MKINWGAVDGIFCELHVLKFTFTLLATSTRYNTCKDNA